MAHSITLSHAADGVGEIFNGAAPASGGRFEGSPADCVKLGIFEFCPQRPELVVSGINGGLNAGINVLYSGTVAAAIEGRFYGITSVAVSLEYDEHAEVDRAAELALRIIRRILARKKPDPELYNLNIPTLALREPAERVNVKVVPMGIFRYGEEFEKRIDPRGRPYFWATSEPPPPPGPIETDISALRKGCVTITPLHYDLTKRALLEEMESWPWGPLE